MAAFRAGFLKLFSEFLQKGIFAGIVNVAVQHKALLIIVRPVKGHWIMTQDDVPSGISNRLSVSVPEDRRIPLGAI